jgi:predicted enzyme related to lactoylglutathione lyase
VQASEVDAQPWGLFVYFSDPDGNTWALQQVPPRS